jgi:hypothetical protein
VTATSRIAAAAVTAIVAIVWTTSPGEAHKPITSPYTYNEDVFPLLRDRCGRCHVSGGVAPMSLMTHADTVPWGESIKTELLAGSMPPWSVDSSPGRFRNVEGLTAKEMNVLLTWVTGGTPLGDDAKSPSPMTVSNDWRLGPPDLSVPMPAPFTVGSDTRETTAELTLPTSTPERRFLRAVDLHPGAPSMVRAATISVKAAASDGAERLLALWLPGDDPVSLDSGLAYELPAGAELSVRILYRKTWEYERKEMSDRSTVGLYFASGTPAVVNKLPLGSARTVDQDVRALALYPDSGMAGARVKVVATRPDGSRVDLIAFHPRPDWVRRYWFVEPIALPRGTRIDVTTTMDDEMPLLPLSTPPSASSGSRPSALNLTLNVVPGR